MSFIESNRRQEFFSKAEDFADEVSAGGSKIMITTNL